MVAANPQKAAAKRAGKKHYFTGKPCRHGHKAPRRVADRSCIECVRVKARKQYWRDTEKAKIRNRRAQLRRYYGLTIEQWESLFDSQGRRCAICGSEKPDGKNWHTDHCHETGHIRGITCGKCNVMLAMARDDVRILQRAALYLLGIA